MSNHSESKNLMAYGPEVRLPMLGLLSGACKAKKMSMREGKD